VISILLNEVTGIISRSIFCNKVFDLKCYWGCFGSAVVASLAMQILAGVSGSPIRPFVKADLNDGQYESFRILLLRTLVDAIIAVG
jgi:hypothetical protein